MIPRYTIPRHTIRSRITALLLTSVLTALLANSLFSAVNLNIIQTALRTQSVALGETAAQDAEKALEDMTGEQMLRIAVEKAALIEEKFHAVTAGVHAIAQTAEGIYQNPQAYPDREVALPARGSHELAAQLLWSSRLADSPAGEPALPAPSREQTEEIKKLGNLQDLLVQYNEVNDMISSAYLATQSGFMIQADYIAYSKYSGENEIPDYYEASERPWFRNACLTEMGNVVFSEVLLDVHENRECIVCSGPVYRDGEIVAVAGIGSYLDTIREEVLNTTIGESGYAFLVNDKGQIIISGADAGETADSPGGGDLRDSGNRQLADAAEDMVCGDSGLARLTLEGREVYLAYAPLRQPGWSFAIVMDVEEVIAPARESERTILNLTDSVSKEAGASFQKTFAGFAAVTLLIFLAAGAAGAGLAGRLSRPIRELTKAVAGTEGGNLDGVIHIHTGDEVEELCNAFNHMRAQLKTYIENLEKVTADRERIRTELSVATGIQADMLPDCHKLLTDREEFDLYAQTRPAKEVGGDFYDFFLIDEDHLAFLVADVSGKGVPAALFMVVAMTLIHTHLAQNETPGEVFEKVNRELCGSNENGMFLTAWLGTLELSTGRLLYVNAGHNSPLRYDRDAGRYQWLTERSGFVLAGLETSRYQERECRLQRGDRLFLYSDGVTEANNAQQSMFGEARLEAFLNAHAKTKDQEICLALQRELSGFQGEAEQFDDITMLSLTYRGEERAEMTDKPSVEHMREFSDFVKEQLEKRDVSGETVLTLRLALDEILSNICRYSGAATVTVGVGARAGMAFLCFEDDGVPYNPLEKPDPDVKKELRQREEGGLGIYLVKKFTDRMTYEYVDGKNRFRVEKRDP